MLIFAGMAELADAYGSGPYESDFMQVRPLLPATNENPNFDTKLRFCFFAREHCNNGIFTKKKSFRVMDGLLKSEHFQPSHTNSVHSETFP